MNFNGRDDFHIVPEFSGEVWDAVERVPTVYDGASSLIVAAEVTRL